MNDLLLESVKLPYLFNTFSHFQKNRKLKRAVRSWIDILGNASEHEFTVSREVSVTGEFFADSTFMTSDFVGYLSHNSVYLS